MTTSGSNPGSVATGPRLLLRLEGLAVLTLSVALYRETSAGWMWFAILFLTPDVSMLGYLRGPRLGALLYNSAHTYFAPLAIATIAYLAPASALWPAVFIWTAHIGFDRLLGYGLKYPTAFGHTHLGTVGR
jgi:hypothetical protein